MTFNYMPYILITGLDAVLELCFPYNLSSASPIPSPEFSDAKKSSFDNDAPKVSPLFLLACLPSS